MKAGLPVRVVLAECGRGGELVKFLSTLGVMYKFTADPVGELGLDFLMGWQNSRLSCVSDAGFWICDKPREYWALGDVTFSGVILWNDRSELDKLPKLPRELLVLSLLSELFEPNVLSLWK